MKKCLSMLLAIVMVLGLLPATAFATGPEEDVVYLSISFDSNYIDDKNGNSIAYVPVPMSKIEAIDLAEYGLDNMLFDADGDGAYETTALQLLIYAHEELYGGDWGDVNFDALPGSSYFRGGIFGFTENLVYFHNGDFPVDESQQSDYMTVGATSDRIVLEAGDFLDVASFSCYNFLWDQAGGFHLFADENDNYTHDYTANAGEALDIKLKHSFCDLMYGIAWVKDVEGFEVYYGTTFGQAEGSVTTDESGNAQITFPNAGTYYIWCDGGIGSDDGTHGSCEHYSETGEPCIVSSPAFAKATVTGATAPEAPRQPQSVTAVLNATLAMQAATVAQPSFGTNYGEWTVFGLARGGYYANDSQYFADYYDRIVEYVNFDANGLSDITVTGNAEGNGFPATFFTITFLAEDVNAGSNLEITMEEMTIKLSSDSGDSNAMLVVDTTECAGSVTVVKGISYSAGCLYTGDGIDHIPANKKAVAVSVVGVESVTKLAYSDGTYEYVFKYSREISEKTGIATYVALVDASKM